MPFLSLRMRFLAYALAALAGTAAAGGFSIYEAGARATGMGCAVTASVDDGSAMFYNIAGISFMPGTYAELNLMPVAPKMKFQSIPIPEPGTTAETVDQSFLVPGVGVTHNTGGSLAFGVGVAAPFGLGVEWQNPETYSGRFTSYDVDLATVYITPAVSYKLTPRLAIAAGVDIATQHIQLNRFSGVPYGGDGELVNALETKLEGTSDINITPCVGLMYKPTERLSLGVMYHHEKNMNYEGGDGTITNVAEDPLLRAAVDPLAGEYDLSTELGLPHMLSAGIAYQVHERLMVELDLVHFGWSNFDELTLTFDPNPDDRLTTTIPQKYKDRVQVRLGLDYDVTPKLALLAGYARDRSPQLKASMGALLPDATRNDFSIGAQYVTGPWRLTAAYMAVLNETRDNLVNGSFSIFPEEAEDPEAVALRLRETGNYESVANIFAVGVGHQF